MLNFGINTRIRHIIDANSIEKRIKVVDSKQYSYLRFVLNITNTTTPLSQSIF